jgi:GT2 family glycosyltransferase
MINIDVICLTNTNDTEFYELTKRTIDTLSLTNGNYKFNIKLIESNYNSTFIYDYPNVDYIKLNQDFHYNRFLNIGLKYCTNDWVLIINNDLVFTPEWLDNIMVEYHSDPNIKSFSPFEPDWFNKYYYGLFNEGNVYTKCS